MAIIRLQGEKEKSEGIFYEFDDSSRPLGEGGMGKVFRGRQVNIYTNAARDVAIKFMFAGLSPNVIKRAEDEASIRIHHDNLVEMMGFLTVESKAPNGTVMNRYHVVSELLIGVSLSDLIQGIVTDQNGLPIPYAQTLYKLYNTDPAQFAVLITKKILSGIMALHDAGYIHRDIDPSNIMITRDEKVKLIDFGIAKKVDGLKSHDRNLTTAGQFMGKPQYAAPELIIGDIANQNKPTDIYAIGVLLYQLIIGHLPFEGPANVVLNSHLHTKLPLKQIKDSKLRKIVEHATEKDCTRRYQSAAEFRADLDSYTHKLNNGGKSTSLSGKIFKSSEGKKPTLANYSDGNDNGNSNLKKYGFIAAGIAVVVACIVAFVFLSKPKPKPDPEPDPVPIDTPQNINGLKNINGLNIVTVRNQLLNPSTAKEGFSNLQKMADTGDLNAKFTLSRLYAISSGSFTLNDEFVTMQANLENEVSQNANKAHDLLKEIVSIEPNYYPALYELACDYYEGSPLSGSDSRDLKKAKDLLDRAYNVAEKENDVVYKNKISALLRKY